MVWQSLRVPHVGDDDTSGTYTPENVFGDYVAALAELRAIFPDGITPVAWTPRLVVADANGFTNTTASSVSITPAGTCTKSGHTFVDGMKVIISSLSAGSLTGLANDDQFYITEVGASTFKFQDGRGNPTPKSFGGSGTATATVSTVGHAWTPSGGSGGTNPTLGSGSIASGLAWRIGKWAMADYVITFGSSAAAGSGAYRLALPWPCRPDRSWVQQPVGSGHLVNGTVPGTFGELGPGAHPHFDAHVAPSVTSDVCGLVIGSQTPVNGILSAYTITNPPSDDRTMDASADTLADLRAFTATLAADTNKRIATNLFDNVAHNVPWAWGDTMSIRGTFGYWIA